MESVASHPTVWLQIVILLMRSNRLFRGTLEFLISARYFFKKPCEYEINQGLLYRWTEHQPDPQLKIPLHWWNETRPDNFKLDIKNIVHIRFVYLQGPLANNSLFALVISSVIVKKIGLYPNPPYHQRSSKFRGHFCEFILKLKRE